MLELLRHLFSIEEDFTFDTEKQLRGLELLLHGKNCQIVVAETNEQIIGMTTGQLLISTAEGAAALFVEDVVVAPAYQGRGIGSALVEEIGNWAQTYGAVRMQLLADRENDQALNFYKKLKWKQTRLICLRKYHVDSHN